MRLFIAVLFLLSASVSFAAGITSKTADFVIYKNSLGSSTIPIPSWELVVDGDSLAGSKSLPVPRSDKAFSVKLPIPRAKLLPALAKFAKLNPYIFVAQGLIDLYYDESIKEFMIKKTPSSGSVSSAASELIGLFQRTHPGSTVEQILVPRGNVKNYVMVNYTRNGQRYYGGMRVDGFPMEYYIFGEGGVRIPYDTPYGNFNSLRDLDLDSLPRWRDDSSYAVIYDSGIKPQLEPATETDIVQNLDKNLTVSNLHAVRDLVEPQGWTLETDTTPTVTGPSEVVISTQTRTRQNSDGTTTTEKVVEKNVYTYNGNTITENHVTQVFNNNQLVENNVTEVNNETNSQPVDYTFQPPTGEYPTDMKVPEKRDLVAEVLNPVASQLQGFRSKIGLRGSGQCSFDVPFTLGPASGSGRLDFCQYQSTFSTLGSMLVAFAYLMAGLIVLGMRH